MLILVSGASGAGKTALHGALAVESAELFGLHLIDTDARGEALEACVRRAIVGQKEKITTVVFTEAPLGELLSCPSANELDRVGAVLLDCADVERAERAEVSQEDLNWAAFHRMHAVDPEWNGEWTTRKRGDPRPNVYVIDTTETTIDTVHAKFVAWLRQWQTWDA